MAVSPEPFLCIERGLGETEPLGARAGVLAEKTRLRNAEVLNAKLPAFWQALIKDVEALCTGLRERFPNNRARHCNVERRGTQGFRVDSEGSLARCSLLVMCNVAGRSLDYHDIALDRLFESEHELSRGQIGIRVRPDDESLVFNYRNQDYDVPKKLAEALVRHVIQE